MGNAKTSEREKPMIDPEDHRLSLRLTFEFEKTHVGLTGVERIRKITRFQPRFQPGWRPRADQNSGAWLDFTDDYGNVLFYWILRDPLSTLREVHSPGKPIRLVHRPPGSGLFQALTPDAEAITGCTLYAGSLDDPRLLKAARKVESFEISRPPDRERGLTRGGLLR